MCKGEPGGGSREGGEKWWKDISSDTGAALWAVAIADEPRKKKTGRQSVGTRQNSRTTGPYIECRGAESNS